MHYKKPKSFLVWIIHNYIMVGYRNVKVPAEMMAEIEKIIEERKELGYRSNAEFIIESIRKRIEELSKGSL